jgi:hypothetical protein
MGGWSKVRRRRRRRRSRMMMMIIIIEGLFKAKAMNGMLV